MDKKIGCKGRKTFMKNSSMGFIKRATGQSAKIIQTEMAKPQANSELFKVSAEIAGTITVRKPKKQ
jgi:anti-sigma-K factor RskA